VALALIFNWCLHLIDYPRDWPESISSLPLINPDLQPSSLWNFIRGFLVQTFQQISSYGFLICCWYAVSLFSLFRRCKNCSAINFGAQTPCVPDADWNHHRRGFGGGRRRGDLRTQHLRRR